jgi:hypothetical protein
MFAEFPSYPGSVLVAGYQGWDQAWGFGARAGHALPGAAEPTQLSVLPWDTLPDLIGVLDGQLPALPVVRVHALLPQITPAYFELELQEPTLASVALDGSNVRARFGIVPGRMVWVTRDPFGGPTRRLCWDLVHNRPCQ